MHNVLVGYDGSAASAHALDFAAGLAQAFGATLHVIAVGRTRFGGMPGRRVCALCGDGGAIMNISSSPHFFDFETDLERTLVYIPLSVRRKLDLCGLKVSLDQWQALPAEAKSQVLTAPCDSAEEIERLRDELRRLVRLHRGEAVTETSRADFEWRSPEVPEQVQRALQELGLTPLQSSAWSAMTELQRYALVKVSRPGHTRNLPHALQEFGLESG